LTDSIGLKNTEQDVYNVKIYLLDKYLVRNVIVLKKNSISFIYFYINLMFNIYFIKPFLIINLYLVFKPIITTITHKDIFIQNKYFK